MSYSRSSLQAELVRDEALRLVPYRCTAGKLSNGIGRNLDDIGIRASELHLFPGCTTPAQALAVAGRRLTRDQATGLFWSDVAGCEADLDRRLPWWRTLDDVRQRVLLNMCFNLGIARLLGFRNTLAMIRRGEFAAAARGMANSLWARQVGQRAVRLQHMMRTGKDWA